MSSTMSEASAKAANVLSANQYMETVHAEWVIYSMCALSIIWAIIQTILIFRMNMDPSKVRSQFGMGV